LPQTPPQPRTSVAEPLDRGQLTALKQRLLEQAAEADEERQRLVREHEDTLAALRAQLSAAQAQLAVAAEADPTGATAAAAAAASDAAVAQQEKLAALEAALGERDARIIELEAAATQTAQRLASEKARLFGELQVHCATCERVVLVKHAHTVSLQHRCASAHGAMPARRRLKHVLSSWNSSYALRRLPMLQLPQACRPCNPRTWRTRAWPSPARRPLPLR
jgi:hypothetical protein